MNKKDLAYSYFIPGVEYTFPTIVNYIKESLKISTADVQEILIDLFWDSKIEYTDDLGGLRRAVQSDLIDL